MERWTGPSQASSHAQNWVLEESDPDTWAPLDAAPDATQLMQRARQLQAAARASTTKKSYAHWWRVFAEFCVELQWARNCEAVPLPVPANLVVMWVAWLSERYAESTISVSLAAISVVHSSNGLQAPTGGPQIRAMLEAVARTGKVRGVEEQVVVTPEHIKAFVRLQSAWSEEGSRWSDLRLARAKAMVCLGFMAYLRKSEVGALDRCDVWRAVECTKVRVCKAKNDPVGRGRVTIVGAACGDSREVESTIWRWIELAGLSVSSQCSKSLDPRGRCAACGPLFPRLAGRNVHASRSAIGKSTLTTELRGLFSSAQRSGLLAASIDPRRFSAIALRRGGNSAAAAAGVSSLLRAAHGRWRAVETPDQSYTFMHQAKMVALATTMLAPSL